MKCYEDKHQEVMTKHECVLLVCDLCGRKAEQPATKRFGYGGESGGRIEWYFQYTDMEDQQRERDLCCECAEALAMAMGDPVKKTDKRKELLALIGRAET